MATNKTNDHGCLCTKKLDNPVWIGCDICDLWWHTVCCNLKGITKDMANTIKEWRCPTCLGLTLKNGKLKAQEKRASLSTPQRTPSESNCTMMRTMMAEELHKVTDLIKNDVRNELKTILVPEMKETITATMEKYTTEATTIQLQYQK